MIFQTHIFSISEKKIKENQGMTFVELVALNWFTLLLVYSIYQFYLVSLANWPIGSLDLIGSLGLIGLSVSGNDVCRMSAGNMTTPTQFRQNVLKVHEKKFC